MAEPSLGSAMKQAGTGHKNLISNMLSGGADAAGLGSTLWLVM